MASDTIKRKFMKTYKSMKYLEHDAEFQSYIVGSSIHSLDASVNIGNASHYDNCDIGYGVVICFPPSGTTPEACSYDQSIGVSSIADTPILDTPK